MPTPPSLRELQEAFWRSLAAAAGTAAGSPVLDVIEPSAPPAPAERLAISAGMYVARLVEVLREDFGRVAAILGDERFADAARAYVARHPSEDPSVRHVGPAFPASLAEHAPEAPFLADLARLEWARLAVFDARDPTPL